MSLDVYLRGAQPMPRGSGIFVRRDGRREEISRADWDAAFPGREPVIAVAEPVECYSANITHNLGRMAGEAGIYKALWRPEEIGIDTAKQLINPLSAGLVLLKAKPDHFKQFNPENGWGTYEGLVNFVSEYLDACKAYPEASVSVSR